MTAPRPFVVGLIGGIGSGKSAAATAFTRRGARVVNADALGHEALKQPAIRDRLVALWGKGVLDAAGQVDRPKVAAIVFRDPAELRRLEQVVHPYIASRIDQEVGRAATEGISLVVVDAAVLLEAGWDRFCDRVVFVDAPAELRRRRVTEARGWAAQGWEDREAAQLPLTVKYARADHVVDNASTFEHLTRQIDDLVARWGLSAAATPANPVLPSGLPDQKMN